MASVNGPKKTLVIIYKPSIVSVDLNSYETLGGKLKLCDIDNALERANSVVQIPPFSTAQA